MATRITEEFLNSCLFLYTGIGDEPAASKKTHRSYCRRCYWTCHVLSIASGGLTLGLGAREWIIPLDRIIDARGFSEGCVNMWTVLGAWWVMAWDVLWSPVFYLGYFSLWDWAAERQQWPSLRSSGLAYDEKYCDSFAPSSLLHWVTGLPEVFELRLWKEE